MSYYLSILSGQIQGQQFPLESQEVRIGRSMQNNNDIVIPDGDISRTHCRVFRRDNVYYIEDLDSANGTFVDTVRLYPNQAVEITPDTSIKLGHQVWVRLERGRAAVQSIEQPTQLPGTRFQDEPRTMPHSNWHFEQEQPSPVQNPYAQGQQTGYGEYGQPTYGDYQQSPGYGAPAQPQGQRIGCKFCFRTLDPNDPDLKLREFVQCTGCGEYYHKECWSMHSECSKCNSTSVKPAQISPPPRLMG